MVKKTPEEEYTETRRARIILRAKLNDVPLLTIITAVMVVVLVYLTGKVLYRLRDILLLMVVGSFIALRSIHWSTARTMEDQATWLCRRHRRTRHRHHLCGPRVRLRRSARQQPDPPLTHPSLLR